MTLKLFKKVVLLLSRYEKCEEEGTCLIVEKLALFALLFFAEGLLLSVHTLHIYGFHVIWTEALIEKVENRDCLKVKEKEKCDLDESDEDDGSDAGYDFFDQFRVDYAQLCEMAASIAQRHCTSRFISTIRNMSLREAHMIACELCLLIS
jgi:hypothetical protein